MKHVLFYMNNVAIIFIIIRVCILYFIEKRPKIIKKEETSKTWRWTLDLQDDLLGIFNDSCIVYVSIFLTEYIHKYFGWVRVESET